MSSSVRRKATPWSSPPSIGVAFPIEGSTRSSPPAVKDNVQFFTQPAMCSITATPFLFFTMSTFMFEPNPKDQTVVSVVSWSEEAWSEEEFIVSCLRLWPESDALDNADIVRYFEKIQFYCTF